MATDTPITGVHRAARALVDLEPPLRPMTARAEPALPVADRAARSGFEPKFDGFLY